MKGHDECGVHAAVKLKMECTLKALGLAPSAAAAQRCCGAGMAHVCLERPVCFPRGETGTAVEASSNNLSSGSY